MNLHDLAKTDQNAMLADGGYSLAIYRVGVLLCTIRGFYWPKNETLSPFEGERVVARASITLRAVDAASLTVTDTVQISGVGERKLYGQPRVNGLGWVTWDLVGA